nr:hypothetical protein BaRGS_029984 [Batillaria attramentaria]
MSELADRLYAMSSVNNEDIEEASALYEYHPDLQEDFNLLLDFMEQWDEAKSEHIVGKLYKMSRDKHNVPGYYKQFKMNAEFFALIGGADVTMKIDAEKMSKHGWEGEGVGHAMLSVINEEVAQNSEKSEGEGQEDGGDKDENQEGEQDQGKDADKGEDEDKDVDEREDKEEQEHDKAENEDEDENEEKDEEDDEYDFVKSGTNSWDRDREKAEREEGGSEGESKKETLEIVIQLRSFWVEATDSSPEFARRLVEGGIIQQLAPDMGYMPLLQHPLKDTRRRIRRAVFRSVIIFHNCARNPHLRQQFVDNDVVAMLFPILTKEKEKMRLASMLAVSYFIEEEDKRLLLADEDEFALLLGKIQEAAGSDEHRDRTGWRLEELLQGLCNMARNDDNKKVLIGKDVLDYLKPILRNTWYKDQEKRPACEIVWQLAMDTVMHNVIKEDTSWMGLLRMLKKHHNPDISKCADGALFVLDKHITTGFRERFSFKRKASRHSEAGNEESEVAEPEADQPEEETAPEAEGEVEPEAVPDISTKGHIMISYSWDDQKTVLKVRDALEARNYKVWVDVDDMSGNIMDAMAEAIEDAEAVLMCVSPGFKDSTNCRTEVEYAHELQKPLIPLLMEPGYRARGWLGMMMGKKLYFDFSGKFPFDVKVEELVRELERRGLSPSS